VDEKVTLMPAASPAPDWPDIPYPAWRETCSALQLYCQMIGKYRLARTPWLNHSWSTTLFVNARGLTTSIVPDGGGAIEIALDLVDHAVVGSSSSGGSEFFSLGPMSVADFDARLRGLVRALGGTAEWHGAPNEVPDPVPFARDTAGRPYDAAAVTRFFRALLAIDLVFKRFRTGFLGKASPVHFFWGSFDLAVTRFSGRPAPDHPGGIPSLPDAVTREAYSHEVSSAGFWPGGGPIDYPAFYSYAYPAPQGFSAASVAPDGAFFEQSLGEFLLPYDRVRSAPDPEEALLAFLQSTYAAAAELGRWDRAALDAPLGEPGRVRSLGEPRTSPSA
jgi:hypothetical protein